MRRRGDGASAPGEPRSDMLRMPGAVLLLTPAHFAELGSTPTRLDREPAEHVVEAAAIDDKG